MFGLGFWEMIVLGVVLLVVVGPQELPNMLSTVGRGISKLKRMSRELRDQSGIDDIIEHEGLRNDLNAIRSLSRGRVVDALVNEAQRPIADKPGKAPALPASEPSEGTKPDPAQEYPAVGCDAYGALSDDADGPGAGGPTSTSASEQLASSEASESDNAETEVAATSEHTAEESA